VKDTLLLIFTNIFPCLSLITEKSNIKGVSYMQSLMSTPSKNTDYYASNCFVPSKEDNVLMRDLRTIDNHNLFTLNTAGLSLGQQDCRSLDFATIPFTKEVRDYMSKMTDKHIETIIQKIHEEHPDCLDESMEDLIRQRAKILKVVSGIEHFSPEKLVDTSTLPLQGKQGIKH
jgi:hypothetical protein